MYVFYVNGKFRNVRSFTFYTVYSHFSLIFLAFWPAVCAAAHSYNAATIR